MSQPLEHFDTLALHAGHCPDVTTRSRAVPIYQTTSHVFESAEHGAQLFNLEAEGHIYARLGNPTVEVLEKRVAALEGGTAAVATASGQAAIALTILALAKGGDHIVASDQLYGGTATLFNQSLRRLGIEVSFVDCRNPQAFRAAITSKTRAFYVETIGNPGLLVPDFNAISQEAKAAGLPLIVDNTLASPWVCNPLKHGADIVVHSATKYLGGHGTSLGGVLVDGGSFDWRKDTFKEFWDTHPAYPGVSLLDLARQAPFAAKARLEGLRDFGPALSPFNAFLLLQGIETLSLRVERHGSNALALAQWLQQHPKVAWVNYPGLKDHPSFHNATKYFRENAGFGGILTFGVKGGLAAGKQVINSVKLFSHLANVGDAKSLIIHPASTTHQQLSPEQRAKAGVGEDLIRVSVGLEHIEDLKKDLEQALDKALNGVTE